MRRAARIGIFVALMALAVAAGLWWDGGAWQYGDMPTRGLVRVAGFTLAALGCFGMSAWLRWRRR